MELLKKTSKRTKKNLEKFKNAEFNYAKFVKNYYIEKGEAYITVKVKSIDDIVSKYSTKDYEWINLDFAKYIEECSYYIPVEEAIILEITGKNFSDEEKIVIEKVIKDYFGLQLGDKIIDLDINKKKSMKLLFFGIISLIAVFILSLFETSMPAMELIIFSFWFFVWEFGDLALLERSNLKTDRLEAGQLASLKIRFLEE